MSASIHDHNNEQMAGLLFSIEKRTTPALIIAEIENYRLKEYIANRIKHESSEQFEHHDIDVSKISDTSLAEYLLHTTKESSLTQNKTIIHLGGFQYVMQKEGKFFPELNFEREILFRDIPAVLIFYVSPYIRTRLQEDAPDFWDWVTYWFTFKGVPQEAFKMESGTFNENVSIQKPPSRDGFSKEEITYMIELDLFIEKLEEDSTDTPQSWEKRIPLYIELGHYASRHFNPRLAVRNYQKAIALLQKMVGYDPEWKAKLGDTFMDLGHNNVRMNNLLEAEQAYEMALPYLSEIKKKDVIHQRGVISQYRGDYRKAITYFEKALKLDEQFSDHVQHAKTLHSIAAQYQYLQEYDTALIFFDRAIQEYKQTNQEFKIKYSLIHKAQVYHQLGKSKKSESLFLAAILAAKEEKKPYEEATCLVVYGKFLFLERRYPEAQKPLLEAIRLLDKLNVEYKQLEPFELLGMTYRNEGNEELAVKAFNEGLFKAARLNNSTMVSRFSFLLNQIQNQSL